MKRILILIVAISLIAPAALAYDPGVPGGRGPKNPQGTLWASLSREQKEQMRQLHRKFLNEAAPLLGSFSAKRVELRVLWSDPKADASAIEVKEREAADIGLQIHEKTLKYRLQARSLLTPDQISRFQGGQWLFRGPGILGGGPEILGGGRGLEEKGSPWSRGWDDWGHSSE